MNSVLSSSVLTEDLNSSNPDVRTSTAEEDNLDGMESVVQKGNMLQDGVKNKEGLENEFDVVNRHNMDYNVESQVQEETNVVR